MIGTIARMYLYSKAPKTAFTVLHPVKAAALAKTRWDLRHARAPRLAAAGAAALALPVGYLIGRTLHGRPRAEA